MPGAARGKNYVQSVLSAGAEEPLTALPETSVENAAKMMARKRPRILVAEQKRLVGISRSAMRCFASSRRARPRATWLADG
jgi:CBS domain-containing protein